MNCAECGRPIPDGFLTRDCPDCLIYRALWMTAIIGAAYLTVLLVTLATR